MSALERLAALPGVLGCSLFGENGDELTRQTGAQLSTAIANGMAPALQHFLEVMDTMESSAVAGGTATRAALFAQTKTGWTAVRRFDGFAVLALGHGPPDPRLSQTLDEIRSRVMPPEEDPDGVPLAEALSAAPLGVETLRLLIGVLQGSLGPAARPAVVGALKAMGETPHTLPVSDYGVLVERLVDRIANPAWQIAFRERALALV